MEALRGYLAYQADLGGDELILTAPLAPRKPASAVAQAGATRPAVAAEGREARPGYAEVAEVPGRSREVTPAPPAGTPAEAGPAAPAGLFQMLVQSLEESADTAKAAKAATSGLAGRLAAKAQEAAPITLPTFGSLAECRAFLDANLRGLLTGETLAATARCVHGAGPVGAPLALVAMEPAAADAGTSQPFQGAAGELLGKMMKAIHLDLESLYRTYVVKAGGGGRRCWTRRDLVRLLPLFQAELALAKAPVVLLLGEACAQAVLKTGKGLEELRGGVHRVENAPDRLFAATYHPDDLAGNEDLKRKAWKDLQWLRQNLLAS